MTASITHASAAIVCMSNVPIELAFNLLTCIAPFELVSMDQGHCITERFIRNIYLVVQKPYSIEASSKGEANSIDSPLGR